MRAPNGQSPHLLKVKDHVQLAHLQCHAVLRAWLWGITMTNALKVLVQQLHVAMDDLERQQLVVVLGNTKAEEQAGVSAWRRDMTT